MFFIFIDYLEIPALVSGVTFYSLLLYSRKKPIKNGMFLVFMVAQVYHIFWLTDEIVYEIFFNASFAEFGVFAAWIAIAIDYMELPVIGDLFRRLVRQHV